MKKCKRTLAALLIFSLILLCIPPITAKADDDKKYKGTYTYTVTEGKATIIDYGGHGDIKIPATLDGYPVVEIGYAAFGACSNLSSVTIPEGVVTIGDSAFMGCKELKSVTVPGTVKTIGAGAFYNCESLTTVYLAEGVTTIGERAFFKCKKLTSITLPNSIKEVRQSAFSNCTQLKEVSIPDGIEYLSSMAFQECPNLQYSVYDNAKYLGNPQNPYALLMETTADDITTCQIHESTKAFATSAFSDSKLKTVVIPEGITQLPEGLFEDCEALTEVTIPVSVTMIDRHAFSNCRSLKTVHYAGSQAQWDQIVIEHFNTDLKEAELKLSFGGNEEGDDPFGDLNDWQNPTDSSDSAEGTNKSSQSGSSNQPNTKKKNTVNLWMISTIVLAVIILGVGVLLILKKKKK